MAIVAEVYKDKRGEYRWTVEASGNHRVLGDSGEGYKNKGDCIASLKQVAPDAEIHDLTGDE